MRAFSLLAGASIIIWVFYPSFLSGFSDGNQPVLTCHVVTLFPDLVAQYCSTSIIGRGQAAGRLAVKTVNPRDFTSDRYRKVDDTPYGGGVGMVLKPEPFFAAVESIERPPETPVLLMSPQGKTFTQKAAGELSEYSNLVIICGHYEGFDERIRTLATCEYSIGDYVLTGGELAALVIIDAVGRLVPGVVGKGISLVHESFQEPLLEGPHYTKPANFRGMEVPEVLRSGNHRDIEIWRRQKSLERTLEVRPDLLEHAELSPSDRDHLEKLRSRKGEVDHKPGSV